jgi:signal peptidase I
MPDTQSGAPRSETERQARPAPKDNFRETIDTIVTVVVVVLLLRTYVAEAFMIPTGSMATTLYGYQKDVTCPECGFEFPVNCSSERERQRDRDLEAVVGCICPNCRYQMWLRPPNDATQPGPACSSGDRVLVCKYLYDWTAPNRLDVVVFKNPREPSVNYDPLNYIKRLIGLPGETIGIYQGDLYVCSDLTYSEAPRPTDPNELWQKIYTYHVEHNEEAVKAFEEGRFQIIRKPPAKVLAVRRPVDDNDKRSADLAKINYPPRWAAESETLNGDSDGRPDYLRRRQAAEKEGAWVNDGPHGFRHPARSGELAWLRYRNLLASPRPSAGEDNSRPERWSDDSLRRIDPNYVRPQLITDFLGYNAGWTERSAPSGYAENWVGDLILEASVTIDKAEGQLVYELAKGVDRFQARWDLTNGNCTLVRITKDKEETLDQKPTSLKAAGTYTVRVANVDQRLIVWVNGDLPFGDGAAYSAPADGGPEENDLRPASIGASGGAIKVDQLKLDRDIYYTREAGRADHSGQIDWSNPEQWGALRIDKSGVATYYTQPGHFFCLGDNSPHSSDSREWGLVPQRLMLGRALLIYFPVNRAGRIR